MEIWRQMIRRWPVAGLAALAAGLLLVIFTALLWTTYAETREQVGLRLALAAGQAAGRIETRVREAESLFARIAEGPGLALPAPGGAVAPWLDGAMEALSARAFVVGRDGRLRWLDGTERAAPAPNRVRRALADLEAPTEERARAGGVIPYADGDGWSLAVLSPKRALSAEPYTLAGFAFPMGEALALAGAGLLPEGGRLFLNLPDGSVWSLHPWGPADTAYRANGSAFLVAGQALTGRGLSVESVLPKRHILLAWWQQECSIVLLIIGCALPGVVAIGVIGAAGDRERRRLAAASERLSYALEGANDGLWDWNVTSRAIYFSPRCQEILGYEVGELTPSTDGWKALVHPDDAAGLRAALFDHLEGRSDIYEYEYRVRRKDGEWAWLLDRGKVMARDRDGAALRMVGTHTDVTARKRVEQDLQDSNERLAALADDLDAARRRAEAASRAKSEFLATMSHELRTPLTGIFGVSDILLASELTPEDRERVHMLRRCADGLLLLLNDLLDLSKLEAGQFELEQVPFDLSGLVGDLLALFDATAREKGLRLGLAIAKDCPPRLIGDPTRIRQILFNIVGNALKFTQEGYVAVRAQARPGEGDAAELLIEVEDSGIGMSAFQQTRIFEPLTQADQTTTRRFGGTGAGLAICKRLTEAMGGTIAVASEPGRGATFTVRLPVRVPARRVHPTVASVAGPSTPPSSLSPSGPREAVSGLSVLVAEDNDLNAELIQAMLTRMDHGVTLVENGERAVTEAARGVFDLVLMDLQMPRMDGLEATRRIRALDGPAAHLPIVALTADNASEVKADVLEAGVDRVLTKPVDFDELGALVAELCPAGRAGVRRSGIS